MSKEKRRVLNESFPEMRLEYQRQVKEQRQRERRCSWTRPFGHWYRNDHCVWCDKLLRVQKGGWY